MLEDEEQDGGVGKEAEVKRSTEETMVIFNSRFYNEITGSSGKGCDIGSVRSAIKDDTLCSHYGRNISGRISKIILR